MKPSHLPRKVLRGLPYLAKEIRTEVTNRTPWFIARPRVVHLWRNGGCIMCHLGFSRGQEREELFHSPITDEMIPVLLRQIQEVGGRGTMVSYMCGEPLLDRSLMDWVELAARLRLDFRFTTNGYHIDREKARRLAGSGLFNLGISIESLDPVINEQIRPYSNSTSRVINAIELLLEESNGNARP